MKEQPIVLDVIEENEFMFVKLHQGITRDTSEFIKYLFSIIDENLVVNCVSKCGNYPNSLDTITITSEGINKEFSFTYNTKDFKFKYNLPSEVKLFTQYVKECKRITYVMYEAFKKLQTKTYQIEI